MDLNLLFSITFITLALVFYSLGVWAEKLSRYLKLWHVITFWIGFSFDISGTYSMHLLAKGPFDLTEPHTLTGQIALWLMFGHAIWATYVVVRKNETLRTHFHKYSLFVWFVWLIPYIGGMIIGMK